MIYLQMDTLMEEMRKRLYPQKEDRKYTFMNESIEAILRGLSPQKKDRILSICSCAQPFGMLEYVSNGSILAIDNNPRQIEFAQNILEMIKAGDQKAIDELNLTPKEGNYFTRGKRLEKIAANSKRIRFELRDAENPPDFEDKFTKGYFSNVLIDLPKYAPVFARGALVYVTYASPLLPHNIPEFLAQINESWGVDSREFFSLDQERTKKACKTEGTRVIGEHVDDPHGFCSFTHWTPAIFIRK